jgi:hypothetical protein
MDYDLNGNELKLNWKISKNELKLNYKLSTWMYIQMNELHSIGIYDR